jgi:glutamate carboxypeptidase
MLEIASRLPIMLDHLKQLVETESPSQDKKAVDRVGEIIKNHLISMGGRVEIFPNESTGDHILARFHEEQTSKDRIINKDILLLCHMDTVYPVGTLAFMPYHEQNGRVLGPGVADMKAGAVIGLSAIRVLQEENLIPPSPISILFTSDEEIGSYSSRKLIEVLAGNSRLVLVLEPGMPDGSIKTWRKGVGEFHIVVHGQAAHAGGDHEKGRNAIEELAHQVLTIQKLTNYKSETTLNVGIIQGGTVVNVVPDTAWMDVDLRVMQPGEAERITQAIHDLKPVLEGTSIEITGNLNRPPMPFNEVMKETYEKARSIAAGVGINLLASGTGGASDGNFVAPLGVPLLDGLGAIGGDYHSEKEYIIKDSLISRTRLVASILQNW